MMAVTGTKTIKSTRFSNQNENKGRHNSKFKLWNKKNKNKNMTCANQNFFKKKITKKKFKKNKAMTGKHTKKLMLNILKVINNSTSIYTYWTPSSKKILKNFYMWPMFTHVCSCAPMCKLWMNSDSINTMKKWVFCNWPCNQFLSYKRHL
jgi:hypothetical protein